MVYWLQWTIRVQGRGRNQQIRVTDPDGMLVSPVHDLGTCPVIRAEEDDCIIEIAQFFKGGDISPISRSIRVIMAACMAILVA